MEEKETYREVYETFRALCARGEQPCSFFEYCHRCGVTYGKLKDVLCDEYAGVQGIAGYSRMKISTSENEYMQLYNGFKELCGNLEQIGSFAQYCEERGYNRWRVYTFLYRKGIKISDLPGYINPSTLRYREAIPFEDVIFEEAGFLPTGNGNAITVRVDGHVVVSFPADTDVGVIAKFINKMGKEACHVES